MMLPWPVREISPGDTKTHTRPPRFWAFVETCVDFLCGNQNVDAATVLGYRNRLIVLFRQMAYNSNFGLD